MIVASLRPLGFPGHRPTALVRTRIPPYHSAMITRADIIWLGVSAGVIGSLVGGMMLGIGMSLIMNGEPHGWLLLLPGAPASAIPGWLLARRLAGQL
jgi:hypothetical protein